MPKIQYAIRVLSLPLLAQSVEQFKTTLPATLREERKQESTFPLYLLGAPSGSLCLAHVVRGLDLGDELENGVDKTDTPDDATSNVGNDHGAEEQAADEDVDWKI